MEVLDNLTEETAPKYAGFWIRFVAYLLDSIILGVIIGPIFFLFFAPAAGFASFADDPETGLETWFIRGGSAGAAIYTFRQPGIYAYVNHNLIEAVIKGATAHFKVDGEWNDSLMKQLVKPRPIAA